MPNKHVILTEDEANRLISYTRSTAPIPYTRATQDLIHKLLTAPNGAIGPREQWAWFLVIAVVWFIFGRVSAIGLPLW
jgi:hypothetical protein